MAYPDRSRDPYRFVGIAPTATAHTPSPEATAFAFGAMLQREYGNAWPRLIGIATQSAMQADHEVTE